MLELYIKGCDEAIELYNKAFDATIDAIHRNPGDDKIAHAEIRAFGQCIAFMENDSDIVIGNTMQFCFHFSAGEEDVIEKAYNVLKEGAQIDSPLGSCEWSPCIFSLIDKFGVNWSMFIT
jgi:PhnB protein